MIVCEREEACCHSFQSMTLSPDSSYTTIFKCAALSFPLPQHQVSLHVETVLLLLLHPSQLPFLGVQHISQAANNRFTAWSIMLNDILESNYLQCDGCYQKSGEVPIDSIDWQMSRKNMESRCMRGVWVWFELRTIDQHMAQVTQGLQWLENQRAYSDRMHWMIEVVSTLLGQLHFCRLNYALIFLKYFFRWALPKFNACASPWCAAHFV